MPSVSEIRSIRPAPVLEVWDELTHITSEEIISPSPTNGELRWAVDVRRLRPDVAEWCVKHLKGVPKQVELEGDNPPFDSKLLLYFPDDADYIVFKIMWLVR